MNPAEVKVDGGNEVAPTEWQLCQGKSGQPWLWAQTKVMIQADHTDVLGYFWGEDI